MRVPQVGSVVRVRTRYNQGPRMIPPQPDFTVYEGKVLNPDRWLNDRQFNITGDKDYPIRTINMLNVIDIEIISGGFKDVKTDVKTWTVEGSKGNKYTVTRTSTGWSCTCPGASFRKTCKHITQFSS